MSAAIEAQELAQRIWPKRRTGSVKASLFELTRFMRRHAPAGEDFTHRRAETVWQGKVRRMDSWEMDALRLAEIEEARNEQKRLRARLADLDAKIAEADAREAGALASSPRA